MATHDSHASGNPSMATHWMPFTANRDFKQDPKMFVRAEGVYYYDREGKKILDGSSGLFTTPAGHGRREIAEAVYKQLSELDFTPSFLRGHDKTFELADKIAAMMPEGLDGNALAAAAEQRGVLVEPGDIFFMNENPPRNYLRLGFSSIPAERIEQGISVLGALAREGSFLKA